MVAKKLQMSGAKRSRISFHKFGWCQVVCVIFIERIFLAEFCQDLVHKIKLQDTSHFIDTRVTGAPKWPLAGIVHV